MLGSLALVGSGEFLPIMADFEKSLIDDGIKNGKEISIPCQYIVFTGNWIPDNELARKAGLLLDESKSPVIDGEFRTNKRHIYAVGNATLPIKSADTCALQGRKLGEIIASEID